MRALLFLVAIFVANGAMAQEDKPTNQTMLDPFSASIDKQVQRKRNIGGTLPDGEIVYKSIDEMDKSLKKGVKAYKKEKYAKAYEHLSELAQWGIKEPQALVGIMYVKGQHVDQSIEKGLAWLGVANEIEMDDSREAFDYIYNQLNADQKKMIDTKVADYVSKFGMEAQHVVCKKKSKVGSNLKQMVCLKKPNSKSPLHPIE